jgi:hypothetical protein
MSTDRVACMSIVGAPFVSVVVGLLVLKTVFPLVGTLGHEWAPERTPAGAERSGALGGFAESCADGLSWHNRRPERGKLNQSLSAGME